MKGDVQKLVGISEVRKVLGGWPISTTGMPAAARNLYFDVRDASHGVGLALPRSDHYAVMVMLASSRQFTCDTDRTSREISCRAGDLIVVPVGGTVSLAGGIPPLLRIGIDPDRFLEGSRLSEDFEDRQVGSILRTNDIFALYIGGTIYEEMRKPEADWRLRMLHPLAEALVVHFVTRYGIRTVSDHTGEISERQAIQRIADQIKRTTSGFPDLAELAERAGLSRFHFSRVFKAETGMTPVQFVNVCRMEQAKGMIEAADMSLADVADQLGFSDQSHLTRRFKAIVGSTPAAYARATARRRADH